MHEEHLAQLNNLLRVLDDCRMARLITEKDLDFLQVLADANLVMWDEGKWSMSPNGTDFWLGIQKLSMALSTLKFRQDPARSSWQPGQLLPEYSKTGAFSPSSRIP